MAPCANDKSLETDYRQNGARPEQSGCRTRTDPSAVSSTERGNPPLQPAERKRAAETPSERRAGGDGDDIQKLSGHT
ncbi:hypothetical protein GBF38_002776 [Nibea albiflora]|uniref:Uncharacterized protein n=1 Tax=Nibea albiflora TaxID=240163 RepID=A0ACB7FIT6_NIBAL|nr:hypothetical protein GBF38_002776 [Nibea albiflora]